MARSGRQLRRPVPGAALSLYPQLKTSNILLEQMVNCLVMANWSFLTSHAPGADVHRTRPRRTAATSQPAWASPSAAPTASSPTSPGPVGDQAERWPATATRSRRTCRCRRLPARNLPFGEVLAVVARPRLSSGRFFTPRTLVEPRPSASARPAWWPTCREPRDHLRRPRRPVPLQPELPADAVPLTLPKGVVSGWGIRDGRAHRGGIPCPNPMAVPRRDSRQAHHCLPARRTPACPGHLRHARPPCCSHRPRRQDARSSPRRPAAPLTRHLGPMGAPGRRRLVPLRRRTRPGNAFTRPDEPAPSTSVQVSGYFVEFTASATRTPT